MTVPHITVCICTYRRPELLRRLLVELEKQQAGAAFTFSVAVVDNDAAGSARSTAQECAAASGRELRYELEPQQNIARARNRVLSLSRGEYVACIDDDEFPTPRWLASLLETCRASGAAGVLGPVLPDYAVPPPDWVVRGGMFDRPRKPTGAIIGPGDARTGNVLLVRESLGEAPFDERFASGGEDVDFFRRRMAAGERFVWCDEAAVHETVPAGRLTRGYQLRRAFLRGRNTLRQSRGRVRKLLTSLVALPLYTLALPILALAGQHHFMKYLIKWCDHAGRLLAAAGIATVRERDG